MMVNAEIRKVKIEITASEDEDIKKFCDLVIAIMEVVCHANERKEFENISK